VKRKIDPPPGLAALMFCQIIACVRRQAFVMFQGVVSGARSRRAPPAQSGEMVKRKIDPPPGLAALMFCQIIACVRRQAFVMFQGVVSGARSRRPPPAQSGEMVKRKIDPPPGLAEH
jgi:hypothetical protein